MLPGPAIVYGLCLLTSVACAALLVRSYRRTGSALLMWSAACFSLLALNNLFVVLDMVLFTGVDFTWLRQGTAFAAVGVLLYGFIWETH